MPERVPRVMVAATLDTKARAVETFAAQLREQNVRPVIVDCGLAPSSFAADIDRDTVEARGSENTAPGDGTHRERLGRMRSGLGAVVRELVARGEVDGFVSIGGGTGASIATEAFTGLPFGMPKMLVSTGVAEGVSDIVGAGDVILVQPGVDVMGGSEFLAQVLRRAAAAIAAMVRVPPSAEDSGQPQVAVTAFGITSPAAEAACRLLEERGWQTLVFHARGSGGRALEQLVVQGEVDAVLDLTTTEVADEVVGGLRSAGPSRLDAAVTREIPNVVIPGAIDTVNFAAIGSVPTELRNRPIVRHTERTTLVRSSEADNRAIARWMGAKLEKAGSTTAVLIPERGFSSLDAEGEPFFDPAADAAFTEELRACCSVPVRTADLHINDPAFAAAAVELLTELYSSAHNGVKV